MILGIENNNVSAQNQVQKKHYIEIFDNDGEINVLFIGNSITRHEPKTEIGWENDWGMAASKRENDYVHVTVKALEERFGKINYCIANCGAWELNYHQDGLLEEWSVARNFKADIVIARIGENIWQARAHFSACPIAPQYAKMLEYFCLNPNARVIVTDLFWANVEIDEAIYQTAQEKGYEFVSINDLGEKDENMAIGTFWHSGVAIHPNDLGMQRIAGRIVKQIFSK